jgi:hypothetical protein
MLSLRQKSKSARTTFILLGFFVTVLATMAIRPVASLAEPPEPAEPPQLSFEPGSYDFGMQPLNWGSTQTNFQLRNTGAEAFQVGSSEIVGPGSGAFWTGGSNCYGSVLLPGEACYAQIYFGPYDATEFTAQFKVNVGSYSFSADLSGVGGRAILAPATGSTDFGVAPVGSAGTTREIQVSNLGNMAGGVFIAVVSGGAVGSFQLLDENCTGVELAPAATCTLQVRFRPLSEGVKKATLSLFGDSDGGTQIVLTGVGSAPDPPKADPHSNPAPGAPGSAAAAAPSVVEVSVNHGRPRKAKHKPKVHRWRPRHRRAAVHTARMVLAGHDSRAR